MRLTGHKIWQGAVVRLWSRLGQSAGEIVDISNGKQVVKDWPRGSSDLWGGVQTLQGRELLVPQLPSRL